MHSAAKRLESVVSGICMWVFFKWYYHFRLKTQLGTDNSVLPSLSLRSDLCAHFTHHKPVPIDFEIGPLKGWTWVDNLVPDELTRLQQPFHPHHNL